MPYYDNRLCEVCCLEPAEPTKYCRECGAMCCAKCWVSVELQCCCCWGELNQEEGECEEAEAF